MIQREVPFDDFLPSFVRRGMLRSLKQLPSKIAHPLLDCLNEKIIFTAEVLVETPDSQTGRLHEGCNTRPVQPLGAELASRIPHDPLTGARFVIRLITHNGWIITLILRIHNLAEICRRHTRKFVDIKIRELCRPDEVPK